MEILFDVKVDISGKVARANRNKFQVGLHELVKNGILDQTNAYSDFVRRARLFVSDHSVNPLKAMVRTKVSDPGMERMMIDAIISEI